MAKKRQSRSVKSLLLGDGSQYTWLSLVKAVFVEYVCTLLFVYIATSTVTSGCHTKDVAAASGNSADLAKVKPGDCFLGSTNLVNIAFAFGGSIAVLVYIAASFSGGHLNPAVTIGFLAAGKIPALRAFLYIIFQCLGACTGSALILAIDPAGFKAALGAANRLNQGVSLASAWGFETILTCLLVYTVFAATDTQRAKETAHLPVLAPFAIGMAVFLANIVAIPLDGCSVNPARSFGPAAVAHEWTNHWVFWVGPVTGALVATAIYSLITVHTVGPKVDHVDHPESQRPGQMAHLPNFSGARGVPQSRPGSGQSRPGSGQPTAIPEQDSNGLGV